MSCPTVTPGVYEVVGRGFDPGTTFALRLRLTDADVMTLNVPAIVADDAGEFSSVFTALPNTESVAVKDQFGRTAWTTIDATNIPLR